MGWVGNVRGWPALLSVGLWAHNVKAIRPKNGSTGVEVWRRRAPLLCTNLPWKGFFFPIKMSCWVLRFALNQNYLNGARSGNQTSPAWPPFFKQLPLLSYSWVCLCIIITFSWTHICSIEYVLWQYFYQIFDPGPVFDKLNISWADTGSISGHEEAVWLWPSPGHQS